jgi:hypothetical protein
MKNIYYFILLILFAGTAKAQQLYPTTLSSGGTWSNNGGVMLEYSVGGLVVTTISANTIMYTQGFLQPDAGSTTILPPPINDVVLNSGAGIDNAGTTFINGGIMLEFTVGEVASKTLGDGNNMLTQGILQPYNSITVLPVTGLEFYAKRLNATTVQLDWKTIQEINNRGFHLERKYEYENNFTEVAFVPPAALDGNSSSPLQYQKPDGNNFAGKTLYRIKQEDINGRSTYSVVRIVTGANSRQPTIQVWPVPATGPVNILVNGLAKADVLLVFDMSGKLIRQQPVQNNTAIQVSNFTPGTYILKLAENKDLVQKLVVQ